MSSTRDRVLSALTAALAAACPAATVARNMATPEQVPAGGLIIVRDGNPGVPEQVLGGFSVCTYTHTVPVEVTVQHADAAARSALFDGLLLAIGAALDADPTLGGLAEGLDYGAPETLVEHQDGLVPILGGEIEIVVTYDTPSPLG